VYFYFLFFKLLGVWCAFVVLPARYKDSVRAITPGTPLFLYNVTRHELHGVFEVKKT
jgi:hypothetical protein